MENTQTPFHPDHSSHITYIQHPQPNNNFVPQPSFNTNYLQHPMKNPGDISNPTNALDMALELMSKAFQLNNTTTMNNNQRSSSNPFYSQIARFRENALQNVGHLVGQNAVQNQGTQDVGNQNGLSIVSNIANQYGNGNVAAARAEGNANGKNGAYEETERANVNCTLENNLQQASASGTQSDKAPVYDSDRSAELLEPIPESHKVPQNDSNVIYKVSSVEQSGRTVEQHPATPEEARTLYDSLYNNLTTEVEKVNSVNRKLRETNADLTT
ncbi:hypothetical protein Tco_0022910, partial [Tanacetum coccineum]